MANNGTGYDYPEKFEEIWATITGRGNGNNKEVGYKLFSKMEKRCACVDLEEQLKAKNKWIKELLNEATDCPECGTTEFLCGYKGPGCSSGT